MIYTNLTKKAMIIMFEKHKDQVDKSGIPYVFHPWHVAEKMDDELSTCTALLHDVVEDTDTTIEDLEKMGFPSEVTEALKYLTHEEDTDYCEYIRNIKNNEIAKKVKLSDLEHNSDLSRLNEVTDKDIARKEKYDKSRSILLGE